MRYGKDRRGFEIMEAFISPLAGLLLQLAVYMLMGVRIRDVSPVFMIVVWVLISAATSMAFDRMECKVRAR